MSKRAKYVTVTGQTADQDAIVSKGGSFLTLLGYASRESAGTAAAAAFNIVDGATGSGGTQVVPVELAADSSDSKWFGPDGIAIDSGNLSIDVVTGTVDVTLYFRVD